MKVGASQRKVGDELAVKIITVPPSERRDGGGREREVSDGRKEGWKIGDGKRDDRSQEGSLVRVCGVGGQRAGLAGLSVLCLLACAAARSSLSGPRWIKISSAQRTGGAAGGPR